MTAIRENGATSGIGVLASFAYDDRGRRASLTRGNGLATSYAFDNADRLTSLAQNPAGTADDLTETFSFNPASQIATRTWSNAAYEWNPTAAFLDAYGRNGLNQVTTIPGATLAHDARGNLTFDGVKSFAYDADNRLITATQSGQATVNQAYDPAGRLYQSAGTATTRFLYDGVNVIGEYDGSGALLRRYAHGPGADEPLVWLEGSGTADRRFLMADVRGSVIAVTNAAGTVTSKNTYDAYGAPAINNVGRFQYTGQMWMAELKLYHFKARAYHPALGRFMQTDPIGYGDGLNLYQYAGSDPVNARDPSGMIDRIVVYGIRPSGKYEDEIVVIGKRSDCGWFCMEFDRSVLDFWASSDFARESFAANSPAIGDGGGGSEGGRENVTEGDCAQWAINTGNFLSKAGDTFADYGGAMVLSGVPMFLTNPRMIIGTRGLSLPVGGAIVATGGALVSVGGYLDVAGGSFQAAATGDGRKALSPSAKFGFGIGVSLASGLTGPIGSLLIGGLVNGLSLLSSEPTSVTCPQ